MAWTTPKTWVADEVVLATGSEGLNTHVRDNFNALSLHGHTGVPGDGASTLVGVSFSNTTGFQFADQSTDPTVNGTVQRNGSTILYHNGTTAVDLTAVDQAAAVASLRTLGTGATEAAAGNHQHAISFSGAGNQVQTWGDGASAWNGTDTGVITCINNSFAASSATNVVLLACFWIGVTNTFVGSYPAGFIGSALTFTVTFEYNGVVKKTLSNVTVGGGLSGGIGIPMTSVIFAPNGTGATTYELKVNKTSTFVDTVILVPRGKLLISEIAGSV
ncbi:hypothetical protein CL653_02080 [bacterium]|nr:hypothetical protein [bacterium]|tara:strand:+ start:1371 stop:2192 length:822 start_codon:yes stop_codon:yes gene_type:complete